MGMKAALNEFQHEMIVEAKWAGLGISGSADLL